MMYGRGPAKMKVSLKTALFVTVVGMLAASQARAADFDVSAMINGQAKTIGKISANVKDGLGGADASNVLEEATFTLGNGYRNLMNNTMGCQFRWFQYVTNDPGSPNWYGKAMDVWTGGKDKPYVDPPYNGWDYERNPANNFKTGTPGGDKSPFYEDDDSFKTGTFPTYSGTYQNFNGSPQKVHEDGSADGTSGGIARQQDKPGLGQQGDLKFKTFIVFFDASAMNKTFNVLGGFSWGLSRNKDGKVTAINVAAAAIDLPEITSALNVKATVDGTDYGFGVDGWKAVTGENIACVPEFSTSAFFFVGLTGFLILYRRQLFKPAAKSVAA